MFSRLIVFQPNVSSGERAFRGLPGTADSHSMKALEQYLGRWIRKDMPVYYVDNVTNGIPFLDLYEDRR